MTNARRPGEADEEDPRVMFYPPDEVLRHAKPLPPREQIVVEGVSHDEWESFRQAINS